MKNMLWCVVLMSVVLAVAGCSDDEETVADPLGWWSTEVWGTGAADVLEMGFDADMLTPYVRRGSLGAWTVTDLDVDDLVEEYRGIYGEDLNPFFELWAAGGPAGSIHLAGSFGLVYRENGGSWERVYTGLGLTDWQGVWATDTAAFIVGDGGKILRRDGDQYVLDTPGNINLLAVWGASETGVWAVGNGAFYWNGNAWQSVGVGPGAVLATIDGRAHDDIYAGGETGLILHYDGQSWQEDHRHQRADVRDLQCFADGTVMALAPLAITDTDILVKDGTWELTATLEGVTLDALWGASADDVYASGYRNSRGVLYHYDGAAWSKLDTSGKAARGLLAP